MKFNFLSGDVNWQDYGGSFVSNKLNNGEFDYWLVLEVVNLENAMGDKMESKYCVVISAVAPSQVESEKLHGAMDVLLEGLDFDYSDKRYQIEALHAEGIQANLHYVYGNNIEKVLKEARSESHNIELLFGFYMDKPINALGATGWDFIR